MLINLFHIFRCAIWIEKCNPQNLPTIDTNTLYKNHKLCSLHFEDNMYINFEKTRLTQQAIPTLFKSKFIHQ